MKPFSYEAFAQFILDQKIVGFFESPVTLKSGRVSHWYANWRKATNDVYLLDTLTDFILSFIDAKGLHPDCIYGVPEGATKTAILAQYKWAKRSPIFARGSHCFPMGRAKPKEHGAIEDKFFVGQPKGKTLVLEDTTTTGGSLIETIDKLREAKIEVVGALGLTNRMERPVDPDEGDSVADRIRKRYAGTIAYLSMSSAQDLLPLAAQAFKPKEEVLKAIEHEYKTYGESPISLLVH